MYRHLVLNDRILLCFDEELNPYQRQVARDIRQHTRGITIDRKIENVLSRSNA